MNKRLENKLNNEVQRAAMEVLARTLNTKATDAGNIGLWHRECTFAITSLQQAVNKAASTIAEDRKPT